MDRGSENLIVVMRAVAKGCLERSRLKENLVIDKSNKGFIRHRSTLILLFFSCLESRVRAVP